MKEGQEQFLTFILDRTKEDKKKKCKRYLQKCLNANKQAN